MNQEQLVVTTASELEKLIQSIAQSFTSSISSYDSPPNREVLTVPQAADFLNLSQSTIYTYISERSIPFCKRNGTVWLLRSRLLEWIREGEKQTFSQLSK